MANSNDSTTYVGGYSTTAASNVPPDSGATGKRYQGAAEIRQVKKVLKDSFPSVTGAVTATHTELNILDGVTATAANINQLATNTFTGSFTSPGIDDNADATAVTIDSSENIGIGTNSPTHKLDVNGDILVRDDLILNNGSGGAVFLRDSTATNGYSLRANVTDVADLGFIIETLSGVDLYRVGGSAPHVWLDRSGTELMRIESDGDVGIGETSPDYKLDVNGSLGFTPGSSVTPADNGDVVFELTNNTTLTIKAKGSDGTVRTATVTLA